jgi:alpha-beta hydrolase superfamily lysophospholipase
LAQRGAGALFLIGESDPIAHPERARQVFERLGSADKLLRTYDGFLHEVLNEVGKEQVIQDLVEWLNAHSLR